MNTAEQAAGAIAHLINSRVQSPTKAELAAIIAGHFGGETASSPPARPRPDAAVRLDALRATIREVETLLDSDDNSDDASDRLQAANDRFDELITSAWATPPRTRTELRERALIARHFHRDAQCGQHVGARWEMRPGPWAVPTDCNSVDDRGIAELIHAVLTYAGDGEERHG